MRHALKPELLAAMKQLLRNLDKVKIISPDDIEILRLRRALHQKIDGLETDGLLDEHSDGQMAA